MLTVKHIIVFWICCFTIVAALSYARRAELHRAPPPCPAVVTAPAAVYHYGPLSVSAQGAALTAALPLVARTSLRGNRRFHASLVRLVVCSVQHGVGVPNRCIT